MTDEQRYRQATIRYCVGAGIAALLTLAVYFATNEGWLFAASLAVFALVMAGVQAAVQLVTFLHFGRDAKPRWRTYSFAFTALTVVIIIVGSIWIMFNLNYNMGMTPQQTMDYMNKQNKKGF